jgi:Transposase DDE domain/Transposase domain (DUF772)
MSILGSECGRITRCGRSVMDAALAALSADFAALYSGTGRPWIAPEMLLRAMLLQAFYSVRSERQLMECGWSSICCFVGSSGSASMTRYGIIRPSRRTAIGCWRARGQRASPCRAEHEWPTIGDRRRTTCHPGYAAS